MIEYFNAVIGLDYERMSGEGRFILDKLFAIARMLQVNLTLMKTLLIFL